MTIPRIPQRIVTRWNVPSNDSDDLLQERLMNRTDEVRQATQPETSEVTFWAQDVPGLSEAFFQNTLICLALLDYDFNFIQVSQSYANAWQKQMANFPENNLFDFYPSNAQSIFADIRRRKTSRTALGHHFILPDHPEWGVTCWD